MKPACRIGVAAGWVVLVLSLAVCREGEPSVSVPEPEMTDMEPQVEERLREARAAVLASPQSAETWGRFGKVAHAHELLEEAQQAYRQAESLDPTDERWPYFLGDVLSVLGTDLQASERAFRRTLELRSGYAPAHLRLGNVLLARDQTSAAEAQFRRALELDPGLDPARVALAQVLLSGGELEAAERLLSEVLAESPRHAQALTALGQVYMRQGRREEAREVAERARGAARYNLFSDPLMGEVDRESRSSVVLWERARAFFENGDFEQAARGLEIVVELQPQNADAHHQLALAYGNLGDLQRSRDHLERAVELDPDGVEAGIRLAAVYLEQQNPAAALAPLRRALELAPDDPDARWLLGKAQVLSGDAPGALETFETAKARTEVVPPWADNEWGRALAETGRPEAAMDRFRHALAAEPDNVQSLFYVGLLLEGSGRIEEAVESYCRSLSVEASPPAVARLQALGRGCP